ncbi:MAG TPA: HAD family hydrolase [Chloroflexota bacterium]|nr:HAD family hydrolase [Chloroflexota bacterium]
MTRSRKAIFLDKDGTLLEDEPYNVDPNLIRLMPGAAEAARALREAGYLIVVVTNQSGVARGLYPESALTPLRQALATLLRAAGADVDGFYWCPHHPGGSIARYARQCSCRKPEPGLLLRARDELRVDLRESWMVGDILDDVEAGRRAGCHVCLVNNGHETEWVLTRDRVPELVVRDLRELARHVLSRRWKEGRPRDPAPIRRSTGMIA